MQRLPSALAIETEGSGQIVMGEGAGKVGRYWDSGCLLCHVQQLKPYDTCGEKPSKGVMWSVDFR